MRFTDVAATAGVGKRDRGRGVAWLDYDTDGDPDIFAAGIQAPHALYRNDGDGRFADVSTAADLADPRGGWAAIAADYDGDGRPDLFTTREAWEGLASNSLYRNQGDGTFRDVAPQAGVAGADDSFMAVWTDYDNDGLPDLYVASGITGSGRPNRLYHNQGDGTFADRGAQAGVAYRGKTLGVTCGDYDGDGDSDLYAIDVAAPNHLYRNDGQIFSDVTAEAGVAKPGEGSYVGFFIDSDGDGDLDLFVSAMNFYEDIVQSQVTGLALRPTRAYLYRNDGTTFRDIAPQQGLARSFGSMGAGYGDVDYDGLIDIYLTNGGPIMARFEPNTLFHNRGDRFADITAAAGVGNPGKGHGVGFADYDLDGDLDLYTAQSLSRRGFRASCHRRAVAPARSRSARGRGNQQRSGIWFVQQLVSGPRLGNAHPRRYPRNPLAQRRTASVRGSGNRPLPPLRRAALKWRGHYSAQYSRSPPAPQSQFQYQIQSITSPTPALTLQRPALKKRQQPPAPD